MKLWRFRLPILVAALILIGSFLRLYNLRGTMQFFGDQGRDALIARRILIEHHPALIGPVTSVGNMYLGPLYYYFMVFPLLLTYPDPMGPAVAVALLGCVTLALVYFLGKQMVGRRAAILALVLYTFSPVIITNVRFSWNPNIVPLFSLLLVFSLYRTLKGHFRDWIYIGAYAAILFQLHYITLIVIGFAGLIWIGEMVNLIRSKQPVGEFVKPTIAAIVIFLVSLVPLVIFDLRHNFLNSQGFLSFFTGSTSHFGVSALFFSWLALIIRNLFEIFSVKIYQWPAFITFAVLVIASVISWKKQSAKDEFYLGRRLLLGAFAFGALGLSFYHGSIFDHYLGFMFPISCLVFGLLLGLLWKRMIARPLVVGFLLVLIGLSLRDYPGQHHLGYNVDLGKQTASMIAARVKPGESYNLISFSITNDYDGMNYRYFLTTLNRPPVDVSNLHDFPKLFIIDERQNEDVLTSPQYLIASWPNRKVTDDFWVPNGPHILVLER